MATKDAHPEDRSAERLPPKDPSPEAAEGLSPEATAPGEASGQKQPPGRLIVAGIGASAGGIEALQVFFEALPENLGVAFVVIVHLSPEHPSHLAEILATCTAMPVEQVQNKVLLEGDHVYVIPPGHRLEVSNTSVGVFPFEEPRGQRAPIDQFFRSLAEQYGDGFALILSGGGSDGAVGVKAVKERGGLILVQDPQEAAYDSMPRAAIATGVVDVVLPVRELADRLADLTHSKRRVQQKLSLETPATLNGEDEQLLGRILSHLHARTGHDFSKYKRATVLRRLGRRMQIQRQESLAAYLAFLRHSSEEVQALLNDLLISVTSFFRDPAAFEALQEKVIPQLFEAERANSRIRAWVPGCATGEEAYSIAILLLEEADRREVRPELQLFASDLDEGALITARGGSYPAAIEADVSPERLRRFFLKEGDHYRVTKPLRDCVLFASHSLLKDAPFSRLDLISCRNLLIYLDRELQAQVFSVLRYALRPGGYLFLGASETTEGRYFRALDRTYHLYQAREVTGQALPALPDFLLSTPSRRTPTEYEPVRREPLAPTLHQKLLEALAPPSIVVDESRNALHLSETAGRFLQPPGGPLTQDLTQLVRPELQVELRSALYRAFEQGEASLSPFIPVQFNGTPRRVALLVQPRQEGEARLALVVFLEGGEAAPSDEFPAPSSPSAEASRQLQEVLHRTQTQMRTMREEHDAANEELRAANEELMSLNEEYRTAVEELETSKEELQSLNEELETVNAELKHKLNEISLAHSDLENLMAATEIGTLFLDLKLRIHRFTPRLSDLFSLTPGDQGRPISDFSHRLDYDRLEADARQVLENLGHLERELRSRENRWYLARFRPYRTVDNKIDGVVVTFVDITERKQAEEEIRAARTYAESIVETIHEALVVLSPDLRVESANPVFYEQFKVQPAQTEGRLIYELGNRQWDIPELRRLLEEVLPENKIFEAYEVSHKFEDIGERVMLLNGRRLDNVQLILLAIQDITDRKWTEEALRASEERLRVLIESVQDYALFTLDPLGRVTSWNEGARRLKGYTAEEVIGQPITLFYTEEDIAKGKPAHEMQVALTLGRSEDESWRVRKDGSRFWANQITTPLRADDGTLLGFTKISRDLTERKRAEERLQYQAHLLANINDVIVATDENLLISAWNRAAEELYGWKAEEVLGRKLLEVIRSELTESQRTEQLRLLAETGHNQLELVQYRKDGQPLTVETNTTALYDAEGAIAGYVAVNRDITERKQAEEALRQAHAELEERVQERTSELHEANAGLRTEISARKQVELQLHQLASRLTMAEQEERRRISQILHDELQQLLYGIQLTLEFVRDKLQPEQQAELVKHTAQAATWLEEAITMTRRLTVDLSPPVLKGEGLTEALSWLVSQMAEVHNFQVKVEAEHPFSIAEADMRVLLFQIVRELLFNVVKHGETNRATVTLAEEAGQLVIQVKDEGRGFEVGAVSAKPEGGFGLFSIRERLAQFGGRLEIASRPGEGTQVTLYLPLKLKQREDGGDR